ncbi:MAG TPA: HD domain-containing phosphohydrolase, partial [Spirochaetales bacterium]|nr:HD domain-containing phosphohydrolase [Spirochaetales bacterium]
LLKPDKLSDDDLVLIRDHTQLGDAILSPLRFLHDAQDIVRYHHERWDGTGYPEGLTGKKIPLLARIIAIADSYDAMTSDRPYRKAMPIEAALEEIRAGAGTQFDPELANLFIEVIKEKFAV